MKRLVLNGTWRMQGGGFDVCAAVPGSVVSALLENRLIPDPYYGDNEAAVQPLFDHDYSFTRTFVLEEEDLACGGIVLLCEGLDTVCTLWVNGVEVGRGDNMHLRYRFEVRHAVRVGENEIKIRFRSPVEYSKSLDSPMGKAYASMRKAHCMFGWDWGIRLPDSGIWRDISLEFLDKGRLTDVWVKQYHREGEVALVVEPSAELSGASEYRVAVWDPDGAPVAEARMDATEGAALKVDVAEPRLWWPAGYGEQPLYRVAVDLLCDGELTDHMERSVGLRTVELYRGEGNEGDYRFSVNGMPIFVKGANIVIEDAVISRSDDDRWSRMISNAVKANYNTLRVWGGAYYPPDVFYDLCDRHGILIYQDFMFACRFYWPGEEFLRSISEEVSQTILRLRNHPCLCQWCGNNEADFFYTAFTSDDEETAAVRRMFHVQKYTEELARQVTELYGKTFLEVIPEIAGRLSPQVGYVHSSPSVGDKLGVADMFEYFPRGDSHYYHHVNDDAPYKKLDRFDIRFLSEFGFQSYPSIKTLREYLPEGALEPYSDQMLVHQKFKGGNEVIELYLSRDFFVPKDFRQYVFMSQLMAGEILRYTAEYMRRSRGFSRGLLLWQHNDCWPVVSWAGVDYRGRWKAQQYYAKRFFAPVLVSAEVETACAKLHVINDRPLAVAGELRWALYEGGRRLARGLKEMTLPPCSAAVYDAVELPVGADPARTVLCFEFMGDDECLSRGSVLFVEQNRFSFDPPSVRMELHDGEEEYRIELLADGFVKGLQLELEEGDAVFSDNFFDLEPGVRYTVRVQKSDVTGVTDLADIKRQLSLMCVNEVALGMGGVACETK